jgi:hypothetical protein
LGVQFEINPTEKEKRKKSTRIVDSSFGGGINSGCQILFL